MMQDLIAEHVFCNSNGTESLDDFDFIVVGSGCTAVAFIEEALRLDPFKKILILEKGGFLLPCHYQNLPPPMTALYPLEKLIDYPWVLSTETSSDQLGFCHGLSTFFGGRSLFWSAWCPEPPVEALRDFPDSMICAAKDQEFWDQARDVLQVISLEDVQDPAFQILQSNLTARLALPIKEVPSLVTSKASSLAIRGKKFQGKDASAKFSAAESLLTLMGKQKLLNENGKGSILQIGLNCDVQSLQIDEGGSTTALQTSLGRFTLPNNDKTNIILCAGAIANTTLLCNSWPRSRQTAGRRLTGHFISHITCRIAKNEVFSPDSIQFREDGPELAANCMLGFHPVSNLQFQIQLVAVHSAQPERDAEELEFKSPDTQASAQRTQLRGSEDHIVFSCAALGELSEHNPDSWIRYDEHNDKGRRTTSLQYLPTPSDLEVWSFMEASALSILTHVLTPEGKKPESLEFWHESAQAWTDQPPSTSEMRAKGVVHEASMTFVGAEEDGGSLDEQFRPHGLKDVYVTGNGILPTAGAYNPTLTVCAYAQQLARELTTASH